MSLKVVIAVMLFLGVYSGIEAQKSADVLVVSGKATVKELPEEFEIQIPVNVQDSIYQDCTQQLMQKVNQIKADFKKTGFSQKQLKSMGFSVNENYYYDNVSRKRVKDGYKGSVNLVLTGAFTTENLNKAIKVLASNESAYSINFNLSEAQKQTLSDKAIELAVNDASQKAQMLAKHAHVKLMRIVRISYENDHQGSDVLLRSYAMKSADMSAMDSFELNPQEIELNKQVLIEWAIENE